MRKATFAPLDAFVVRADVRGACGWVKRRRSFSRAERRYAKRFLERFATREVAIERSFRDPLLDAILASYRHYWHACLRRDLSFAQAESRLKRELTAILGLTNRTTFEVIESKISERFKRRGYHTLLGVTAPLREFQVWQKTREVEFLVALPLEKTRINVRFLSGFLSRGWLGYATLDRRFASGWADGKHIYCHEGRGRVRSEQFQVSLLAHEAQHTVDLRRNPRMKSAKLEYRAKLAELSLAKRTAMSLLNGFIAMAKPIPGVPHAQACGWIRRDFRALPKPWSFAKINAFAVERLAADSKS